VIASTLSSVGELIESGSYSRALLENLTRSGTREQDIVMLQDAKNDFMERASQTLDSAAQRIEQGDEALDMMRQQNERMSANTCCHGRYEQLSCANEVVRR
jgi:hypothetical protein